MKEAIKKQPWYHVVLDMMEAKLPNIRSSALEQKELMDLGGIIKKSKLELSERGPINTRIERFLSSDHIANEGDTKIVYSFLWELYDRVYEE